ncbi:MAG: hypothetical protein ACYC7E_02565 [Armatimonadota bacterium]
MSCPEWFARNATHGFFLHGVTPGEDRGQGEHGLLEVRRQVEELHDLGDARTSETKLAREIRVIRRFPLRDERRIVMRQRE